MKTALQTALLLLCLTGSVWFIKGIIDKNNNNALSKQTSTTPAISTASKRPEENISTTEITSQEPSLQASNITEIILNAIKQQNYSFAIEQFDVNYSSLNDVDIAAIEKSLLDTANKHIRNNDALTAIAILNEYLRYFQNSKAYIALARGHESQQGFPEAIDALVMAYQFEHKIEALNLLNEELESLAFQYSQKLYENKNPVGVNQFLLNLYNQFPNNPNFQLRLAESYIALQNLPAARQQLQNLEYNTEYTIQATQLLNQINQLEASDQTDPENIHARPDNSIVIPLIKFGSSYLVRTKINNHEVSLLLDTGASITSVDTNAINQLNLVKTGRSVRLNTANGQRTSQLYTADSLVLGRLQLNQLTVAEIELNNRNKVQGLLGTDVLQQFDYQIQNSTNSLILSPKK